MKRHFGLLGLVAAIVLNIAVHIQADDERQRTFLTEREIELQKKVADLKEKMRRVAAQLEKKEPQAAAKLHEGLQKLDGALVEDDIQRVIALLKDAAIGQAIEKQDELIVDLKGILDLLEDRNNEKDLAAKLAKIRALIKEMKGLQEDQNQITKKTTEMNEEREKDVADMKKAMFWYHKAAEFGDPEAEDKLRELSDESEG